jgi:hypothetical protein
MNGDPRIIVVPALGSFAEARASTGVASPDGQKFGLAPALTGLTLKVERFGLLQASFLSCTLMLP